MRTVMIIALAAICAGCGMLKGAGVQDSDALKAAFVAQGQKLAAEEGIAVTAKELAAIYDNAVVIANSPAAAAISDVVEGNPDASAKLAELLDEHMPKK